MLDVTARSVGFFLSKHRWLRWLQIIFLLPAWGAGMMSLFVAIEFIVVIVASPFDPRPAGVKLAELPGQLLILVASLSVMAGLVSSLIVIFKGTAQVRGKPSLRRKIQIGLALGIVAGCSVLIWIVTLKMGPYTTRDQERFLIAEYMLMVNPPLVLGLIQSYQLLRSEKSPYIQPETRQ
jgi:hypothetical protein